MKVLGRDEQFQFNIEINSTERVEMSAFLGLILFILIPIAFVLWVYRVSKKFPSPKRMPEDGKTDLWTILKDYKTQYGKKAASVIFVMVLLWGFVLLIRISEIIKKVLSN